MKLSKLIIAAFAVITFAATTNVAHGQDSKSTTVSATGTVLAPLTISGSNLDFGSGLFPGHTYKVAPEQDGAAQFDITGEGGKTVNVDFTLPDVLLNDTKELEITFNETDAAYSATETGELTNFDPRNDVATTTIGADNNGLYVWLGGTIKPTVDHDKGTYSGDITIDVTYTGN